MKEHICRLDSEWFEQIKAHKKMIEYRLNDEKRQEYKRGDILIFKKRPEETEIIKVIITDLKYYPTLYKMYEATFEELKDSYKTVEEVVKDTSYYSEEEVKKYGCVAIHFKIVK